MATHRAAVLTEVGKPLVTQDVETPKDLAPYEVLVRNQAIAVNPMDWKQREFGMYVFNTPAVLGIDSAGVIEAVGSDVKDRKVGQRVACFTDNTKGFAYGAYQEKIKVWAALTIPLPDSIKITEAASIPVCFATAATCSYWHLNLPIFDQHSDVDPAKTPIVVLGGSSSVGQNALQLLRNHGFTHLVTTSSSRNFDLVKSLGASHVVDHSAPDVAQKIEEAVGGKAPYILDSISTKSTQEFSAKIVLPGKGKVAIVQRPEQGVEWPIEPPTFASSFRFADSPSSAPGQGKNPSDFEVGQKGIAWLAQALADGKYKGNTATSIDGKDLAAALTEGMETVKKGVSATKVIIEP